MSPKHHDVRDIRILGYSENDWLLGRGAFRGIIGFGDPDSGKSSTSRNQYFAAMLDAGFGALCCTTKRQDTDDYARIARECGREADLLIFSPTSGHSYDAIAHEWTRTSGRGAQDVETIVDFFDTLLSLGKNYSSGGDQRFFELASQQVTRVACHLIKLANEPLSIPNIAAAISSFPTILAKSKPPYGENSPTPRNSSSKSKKVNPLTATKSGTISRLRSDSWSAGLPWMRGRAHP